MTGATVLLVHESLRLARGLATVAEKTPGLTPQLEELRLAADRAAVRREAAQDYLRVVLAQAEIVRSLSASVRQAYSMAGAGS